MAIDKENLNKDRSTISGMFNGIAPSYDLLNHLLSLNIDKYWRGKMVKYLLTSSSPNNRKTLDIACGTGDSTIALYKKGFTVTGADIAQKMMDIAIAKNIKLQSKRDKTPHGQASNYQQHPPLPNYILASAEELPFPDNHFNYVTISFGIRNFNNREQCLREIFRVIKPGGQLAILEFAKPKNKLIRGIYNFYFNNILPTVGNIISKDKEAYKYLAESVEQFPKYEEFCKELSGCGLQQVKYNKYTFGIAVLYTGKKI